MNKTVAIKDDFLHKQINQKLADEMGKSLDGRPIWRVSWTSDQLEYRIGWHEEWSPSGNIFLRRWFGGKEVLKYNYMMNMYVLERLTFLDDGEIDKELPNIRQGSYEPIYSFQDGEGNGLPLNWRIINIILVGLRSGKKYSSPKAREEMLEAMSELEVSDMESYLHSEGRLPLFAAENSVVLDSTKQKAWSR